MEGITSGFYLPILINMIIKIKTYDNWSEHDKISLDIYAKNIEFIYQHVLV